MITPQAGGLIEADCPGVIASESEWRMVRAVAADVTGRAAFAGYASERFGAWELCAQRQSLGLWPQGTAMVWLSVLHRHRLLIRLLAGVQPEPQFGCRQQSMAAPTTAAPRMVMVPAQTPLAWCSVMMHADNDPAPNTPADNPLTQVLARGVSDNMTKTDNPAAAKPISQQSLPAPDALQSDEHAANTLNRDYGPHHPITDAPRFIWRCQCRAEPRLEFDFPTAEQIGTQGGGRPGEPRRRHFLMCPACGRRGRSATQAWSAIIEWNRVNVDGSCELGAFPFFLLAGLSTEEAQVRLDAIRSDLETHLAQDRQRGANGIETGRLLSKHIDAYLGWAIVAQSLIHLHSPDARRLTPGTVPSAHLNNVQA